MFTYLLLLLRFVFHYGSKALRVTVYIKLPEKKLKIKVFVAVLPYNGDHIRFVFPEHAQNKLVKIKVLLRTLARLSHTMKYNGKNIQKECNQSFHLEKL